jgi:hypothetical protein
MTDIWMLNLKAAYEAGYYRTESASGKQSAFPWQNKTCKDCPFWLNNVCRVQAAQRDGDAHTCGYFDASHHVAAEHIIESRLQTVRKIWWGRLGR